MVLPRALEEEIRAVKANLERQGEALEALRPLLVEAAGRLSACLRGGGRIFLCGNGGSAADAQHFAAELVGRFRKDRPGMPATALAADPSVLTALANDFGYERAFSRQVEALGRPGDTLVAFSTSGDSPSILEALHAARRGGLFALAILGRDGGAAAGAADLALVYSAEDTPRIQEFHAVVVHILCAMLDAAHSQE